MRERLIGLLFLILSVPAWYGLLVLLAHPACPSWLMPLIFTPPVFAYLGLIMLSFGISVKRIWRENQGWPWYQRLLSALIAFMAITWGGAGLMAIYLTRHQAWD
ncbi:MAG TPA: hypothetical protein VEL07_08590 [Planctomycetota bacterium]|nr:hypothetical protein [Planctomycetota bacterium]